jgi:alkylated DNA repair dioxygenase AlkB
MDMTAITSRDVNCAPPPGLQMAYDFVSPLEEAKLIAAIETLDLPRVVIDPSNPRSKQAYGWDYLPDDTILACPRLPSEFDDLQARAAMRAGLAADELVQGMLIRYDPGSIIQWHLDKAVWDRVIGISLGEGTTIGFRKRVGDTYDVRAIELPPRSIYVMTGEARYTFEHGLPPVCGKRWSVTFRSFSEEGYRQRDLAMAKQRAGADDHV